MQLKLESSKYSQQTIDAAISKETLQAALKPRYLVAQSNNNSINRNHKAGAADTLESALSEYFKSSTVKIKKTSKKSPNSPSKVAQG